MNSWQKKQVAKGLCIFCKRTAVGGGTKAPKCLVHLQKLHRFRPRKTSRKSSRERQAVVAQYALDNPFLTLQELSGHFNIPPNTIYNMLRKTGVRGGWMRMGQLGFNWE